MRLILIGDINLMGVTDPAVPFTHVQDTFRAADLVFGNLECNLHVPDGHSVDHEGFFIDPAIGGAALTGAGIGAVGLANNVTYGATPIAATIACLDRIGVAHAGAGANRAAARAPAIVERGGMRFGFLQRSSIYWPTNHEAAETAAGIAVIRAHTAYQVPMFKMRPEVPPLNRPGIPPIVVTWPDRKYLDWFTADIAALRQQAGFVVASCHWGLWNEVLEYMIEIAHAAIDAGADVVIGHGPHHFLPIEIYRGKPIFYGLGSFSFHTGHGGRQHGDWIGMMATLELQAGRITAARAQFVRHDARNQTTLCALADEAAALQELLAASAARGTALVARDDAVYLAFGPAPA